MADSAAEQPFDPSDLRRALHVSRGHFSLESGYHGDVRLDLDRALSTPGALASSVQELARRVATLDSDLICGPLTGGAFLAFTVSGVLSRRFCWSRRTPREAQSELYPTTTGSRGTSGS